MSAAWSRIELNRDLGWRRPNAVGVGAVLVLATMLFSLGYFVANTVLVTTAVRLKRNERLLWSDFFGVFGWVGIAFASSAAIACGVCSPRSSTSLPTTTPRMSAGHWDTHLTRSPQGARRSRWRCCRPAETSTIV